MNLTVSLAGHTNVWRFRDSQRLENWLASRPWLQRGGVRVMRVASQANVTELVQAAIQSVRAADDGRSDLRPKRLTPSMLAEGLEAAIGDVLELTKQIRRREWLERVAELISIRPMVFFADAVNAPNSVALADSASTLVEELAKLGSAYPVAVILFEGPEEARDADDLDFRIGGPIHATLDAEDELADARLWPAYLHARLAWEAAGELERARRWDTTRAIAALPCGRDDAFEHVLNAVADADWNGIAASMSENFLTYLDRNVGTRRGRQDLTEESRVFERLGLLWRPPGERGIRPAPWAARALLRKGLTSPCRFQLRNSLICAPLVFELLARCFEIEAGERAACWAATRRTSSPPAPQSVVDRARRFQEQHPSSDARHYPADCPAAPSDSWAFASFGEFLEGLAPSEPPSSARHMLRQLRNALVHGHYASWATLRALREVERRLRV